jgi:RNA polymerase sigma factor (sigma-70 family)
MTGDELSLWERYGRGDEAARKELLLSYLPLVEILAKRIARSAGWTNREDLKQDGVIGLMKAVTKFDPSRGVAFKTFAKSYIIGAILDSSELTRELSRRQDETRRRVRRAEAELTTTLQRNPTIEEVAAKTGLVIEQIENAIDAMGIAFAGALPDAEDCSDIYRLEAAQTEATILVQDAISQLNEREARIIIYYYLEDQSSREIADRLGLTASNVTKIRQRALHKLRELLGMTRERPRDEDRRTGK